tara:strand:- start:16881 stop:18107 length:1227 start_codon:yes stop_codon:yes gene_type:complete
MINFKKQKFSCCILGLGYIGLPTAALIAKKKNKVIGVDINKEVVDIVNKGEVHIIEKGLQNLVKDVVKEGYLFAKNKPTKANVFILAVPTPLHRSINGLPKPNIEFVLNAAISISEFLEPGNLVILESTSPVGTTEKIAELIYEKSGLSKDSISIAYCPERVLPGKALEEIISNSRVIGGINKESAAKGEDFYKSFCKGEIIKTDSRTAELVKLTENAYRDVNIAFANEISMVSSQLQVDHQEVIKIANHHPRVNILNPGCGVGGHCIAIDPWFIASQSPEFTTLIQAGREVNLKKTNWSINLIIHKIEELTIKLERKPLIGIFGLTFKSDIDDLRESPALFITDKLLEKGNDLIICEPNVKSYKDFVFANANEIIQKADILILLVSHYQFKNLNFENKEIINLCGLS